MKVTTQVFGKGALGLVLSFLLIGVVGCATGPSARQLEMEAQWQAVGKEWPTKVKFLKPAAWKAGQYVVTGTKDKGKILSTSRTLLVSKDKAGWVIEVSNKTPDSKDTVSQYLLVGYDEALKSGDFSKMSFGWMKMRDEKGQLTKMSGDEMAMFNAFSKTTLDNMAVSFKTFTDGGDLVVPAGSFPGSNKVQAKVKVFGFDVDTISWYHPAVPVNGLVKTMTADGKNETVLLSFGDDGKPELVE